MLSLSWSVWWFIHFFVHNDCFDLFIAWEQRQCIFRPVYKGAIIFYRLFVGGQNFFFAPSAPFSYLWRMSVFESGWDQNLFHVLSGDQITDLCMHLTKWQEMIMLIIWTNVLTGLDWYLPTCRPYIVEPLLVVHTPCGLSLITVT